MANEMCVTFKVSSFFKLFLSSLHQNLSSLYCSYIPSFLAKDLNAFHSNVFTTELPLQCVPVVSVLPSPSLKDALELDLLFVIQNFLFSTSLPHSLSVTRSQLVHETHTDSHILYIFITSPQEKKQRNVLLSHPVACKEHSVHSKSKDILGSRYTVSFIHLHSFPSPQLHLHVKRLTLTVYFIIFFCSFLSLQNPFFLSNWI